MSWIHKIAASFSTSGEKPVYYENFGHKVKWSPLHPSHEEAAGLRSRWDKLADESLARLIAIKGERDLYTTLKEEHQNDDVLGQLWTEVNTIPEWVDWEQIQRGQDVYYRYAIAIVAGLTYSSLLGGMGAHKIAEVLARTGGFSKSVAKRRMFETTQHILQVGALVRLLHSAVRGRILKLREKNPEYYDLEEFGMPINDFDSIATILGFSATILMISLPKQGIFPTRREVADYIAFWRLVAHYVGCPTDALATPELARAYMEYILVHDIKPSETSRILSQNIIASIANTPPSYPSADFLVATARWLNGNELCDELGLPQAPFFSKVLVFAQCLFVCYIGYSSRIFPGFDKRKIETTKRILFKILVSNEGLGGLTNFELQFVPQLTTKTEAGSIEAMDLKWKEMRGSSEKRSAKVLIVFFVIMGIMGLVGMWLFMKITQFVGPSLFGPAAVGFTIATQDGVSI
ncbi:uncharacterized protein LAJ45_01663 [Morchella importuna]|uniref:uncharacterized protein n=1 Tax=Morchella importuna TaxID=1174673 RepID=UPI001E8E084E|nr:uncharacterized protein LAJ45_01663 [Morchella importuna]KAH8153896.1 hypothetical protein LAJ45_01663 [Morchella importuna]